MTDGDYTIAHYRLLCMHVCTYKLLFCVSGAQIKMSTIIDMWNQVGTYHTNFIIIFKMGINWIVLQ